jgi:hypothetical protein
VCSKSDKSKDRGRLAKELSPFHKESLGTKKDVLVDSHNSPVLICKSSNKKK